MQQLINHLVQLEAVVETVTEFSQVTRHMPAADGMVGAVHGVLHITDHGVEPLEHHLVVVPAILVGDDRFVPALVVGDGGEAAQAVGDHMAPGLEKLGAPSGDLVPGEAAEMAQFQVQGVPFAGE